MCQLARWMVGYATGSSWPNVCKDMQWCPYIGCPDNTQSLQFSSVCVAVGCVAGIINIGEFVESVESFSVCERLG